jgi:hypothetical protein
MNSLPYTDLPWGTISPYRYPDDGPDADVICDLLSAQLVVYLRSAIDAGRLAGYSSVRGYGYATERGSVEVSVDEIVVLHYLQAVTPDAPTTGGAMGQLTRADVEFGGLVFIGNTSYSVETLMIRSRKLPKVIIDGYKRNAMLMKTDGSVDEKGRPERLLKVPLVPGRISFGEIPATNGLVGFQIPLATRLEWTSPNYIFGY